MTNEQIIFNARCELMENGLIGTTGRFLQMEMEDGTTKTMPEPEEIHTYQFWKTERGLQASRDELVELFLNYHKERKTQTLSFPINSTFFKC